VIDLDERLERDLVAFAIIEDRVVMMRDAPRTGIQIEPLSNSQRWLAPSISVMISRRAASASARPDGLLIPALHAIAGALELDCRGQPARPARGSAPKPLGIAVELDRSAIIGFGGEAERGIASYIVAAPDAAPISASRSRRRIGVWFSSVVMRKYSQPCRVARLSIKHERPAATALMRGLRGGRNFATSYAPAGFRLLRGRTVRLFGSSNKSHFRIRNKKAPAA